ncbi:hypothetical protein MHU86_23704 [Fragilaria crotonensis]|nr:hypothetical protein MHU86_23704 [Fragilaria crotonensis]
MQQYLVLCAGVEHEDEINPALLEFRSTRQQLEDGAFVFPACDFLKERLGRGVDQRATRSLRRNGRSTRTVDGRVPQQTPRRTPRTLSESAARDSPAGTHAHEPSRPATSPTPRISPARDDPSRNEVGPERYAPALDSPPTDHSVARALSPGDAHDAPTSALADTPRPLPGKFPSLVPLPTIPLPNVDSPFTTPEPRLADALATILHSGQPRTHATEFRFDWTHDAARHNLAVLKRYALDLDAALRAQPFSALTPGSEFRPTELLAPLLSAHPSGRVFRSASRRAEFREISDSDRLADVRANLARGNHKSARGHEAKLISMLKDEASRGWQLPLPRSRLRDQGMRGRASGDGRADVDRRKEIQ